MKTKKHLAVLMAASLLLTGIPAVTAAPAAVLTAYAAGTSGVHVDNRTPEQIRAYFAANPFSTSGATTYTVSPDVSTFTPGVLTKESEQNALNALNVMRYIAGLDEVQLKEAYSQQLAAAALCNAANNELSHTPSQPSDMPDDLYKLGYSGASSSNLGWGYGNLAGSVIFGYMEDSDSYNIDRLGHRRWCLNPAMGYTGFGQCGTFSGMKSFDTSNSAATQNGVCWPAQEMPKEYFGSYYAWSYTGTNGWSSTSAVTVKLTRTSDGKTWSFSNSSADGDFYLNSTGYGQPYAVIFRPKGIESYETGDSYQVEISGLTEPVSYTVNFFSMEEETPTEPEPSADAGTISSITFKSDLFFTASDTTLFSYDNLIEDATVTSGGKTTAADPTRFRFSAEALSSGNALSPNGLYQSGEQQYALSVYYDDALITDVPVWIGRSGDVDGNGLTNAADACEILIWTAAYGAGELHSFVKNGTEEQERFARFMADCVPDGMISAVDAAEVLITSAKIGAGIISQ